ncbi:MAG: hypothetical protein AAF573_12015 [Bacteroidota bacterium]
MSEIKTHLSRAQVSRAAIEKLYIAMRHLFIRGSYKPLGISGEAMIKALLELKPEIYGSIANPEKVELVGLHYVFQRLPQGIEECTFIRLISREGLESSGSPVIIPAKRRRNCYRIDEEQMYIEMTRGRSDIYDVLTHLTFMYIEAEKIRTNALDHKGRTKRDWQKLAKIIQKIKHQEKFDKLVAINYLSTLLGRTYQETVDAVRLFEETDKVNSLFNVVYWLGKLSINEYLDDYDREITFSSSLRSKIGFHIFGTSWAHNIKLKLKEKNLLGRPLHIISSNLHSVLNTIFAKAALQSKLKSKTFDDIIIKLSQQKNDKLQELVRSSALKNGMTEMTDETGVNIGVQIFDCAAIPVNNLPVAVKCQLPQEKEKIPVLLVMDYAFGEQAYELMDELLKPYEEGTTKINLNVRSVNIMGKAGILEGKKGDLMIPNAHVFEGTAHNYPFENQLTVEEFRESGLDVYAGSMVTVLGTSLQNKDVLRYFAKSSWKSIGLEMEGAHYQKAIQAASKIRNSIDKSVCLRYAYYASDNPLETGSTLASGGLGVDGVKPTYAITVAILKGIFGQ